MPIESESTSPSAPLPDKGMDNGVRMTRRARFTVEAALCNVQPVAEALRAFMNGHMPEEACNAIELGVVEALTNVVGHGYERASGAAVEVSFEQSNSAAIVEVFDNGKPIPQQELDRAGADVFAFDPDDIAHLPEGGMGLAIIKELFDAVRYESEDGANRLVMAKRFGDGNTSTK